MRARDERPFETVVASALCLVCRCLVEDPVVEQTGSHALRNGHEEGRKDKDEPGISDAVVTHAVWW